MHIETEKKYRLTESALADVEEQLVRIDAEYRGATFEENIVYRPADPENDRGVLRIRKTNLGAVLTYKERFTADGNLKQRIEFETGITDPATTAKMIDRLGYSISVIYEKRRKTWHFDEVEVVLDELPFGLFMEVEGTIEEIERAEKLLKITDLEPETRGYPRMSVKYGKDVGGVSVCRFED